ncbi:MAG: epoxide hydrolase [Roseiflexaceae bacterium]|nr:epoxide hydrolase [Roseiflexaceae bacterium]
MSVQPFTIGVPQATLDDLHERLVRTRWPDEVADVGWDYGTNLAYLKELVEYWQNQFDWRAQEAKLNQFAHFRAEIDGVGIHFIHERGNGPNPLPIILTHGWPDSFYRFQKIIPMLTNPERYGGNADDSFDVIVPSIPGFGFSDRKAMASSAVADTWAKLMTDVLGYTRFAAGGGDVGSGVTMALALQHPDVVSAIHLTDVGYSTGQEDGSTMSEAEQQFAGFIERWWFMEGAYAALQMTKPQSLAFGLNDSPVGWAAWVLSFINTGAQDNLVEAAFGGRDELLTNIMIYWATQTAGSSARMYLEDARASYAQESGPKPEVHSRVPAGIALFPREAQFPRETAERSLNVQHWTEMPRGGHFAALEEPELLVEDLRTFFRQFRTA